MQVVVWIIIVLLALLLIWLLRKWIKRLIFIAILLVLAFFIYGIFNPSGASRLWYNVRTFPQRVTSWISDKKEFLDYDSYKLNLSNVWAKIKWEEDTSSVRNTDVEVKEDTQKSEEKKEEKSEEKTIHSFSGLEPQFVEVQQPAKKPTSKDTVDNWYSKTDLIWIVGKYIEDNLDDDTDILVTVQYTKDASDPDKIILETQPKQPDNCSTSRSRVSLKNMFGWLRRSKSETVKVVSWSEEKVVETTEIKRTDEADWVVNDNPIVIEWKVEEEKTPVVNKTSTSNSSSTSTTKKSNGLTQSEIREAEEIFWILF